MADEGDDKGIDMGTELFGTDVWVAGTGTEEGDEVDVDCCFRDVGAVGVGIEAGVS